MEDDDWRGYCLFSMLEGTLCNTGLLVACSKAPMALLTHHVLTVTYCGFFFLTHLLSRSDDSLLDRVQAAMETILSEDPWTPTRCLLRSRRADD